MSFCYINLKEGNAFSGCLNKIEEIASSPFGLLAMTPFAGFPLSLE
jgi:hypothetical protein